METNNKTAPVTQEKDQNIISLDLMNRMKQIPQCAGVFYWEPEVDGQWKPAYYQQLGWGAYGMGAFTTDGRPTKALDAFAGDTNGITSIQNHDECTTSWFDLQGRLLTWPTNGLFIMKQGQETRKFMTKDK